MSVGLTSSLGVVEFWELLLNRMFQRFLKGPVKIGHAEKVSIETIVLIRLKKSLFCQTQRTPGNSTASGVSFRATEVFLALRIPWV